LSEAVEIVNFFVPKGKEIVKTKGKFKQMDYTITAEGIETAEMADALSGIGCDYLQGFYFSRPVPFDEFLEKYAVS
jgi:EAL domain-containing protein (putative c-di-GMP-specific phosphodiesterase class I)